MTQTRLHFITRKIEADLIFAAFEAAFEDEGLPIAVLEVDEDQDIHEVSLYADGDVDAVEARVKDILAGLALSRPVEREALPDIDWVARSLEGLKPVRAARFFVHGRHDRAKRRANDISVEVEAGQAWAGEAELRLFDAPTEELAALEVHEIIGGYFRQVGVVWDGGSVLAEGLQRS